MLSRIFSPAKLNIVVPDRPYRFGETVDAVIELTAKNDLEVREGILQLFCDVHHVESRRVMVPDRRARMSAFHPRAMLSQPLPEVLIPKRISEEQHFRFPISTAIFTSSRKFEPGIMQFDAELPISSIPHARAGDSGGTAEQAREGETTNGRGPTPVLHLEIATEPDSVMPP